MVILKIHLIDFLHEKIIFHQCQSTKVRCQKKTRGSFLPKNVQYFHSIDNSDKQKLYESAFNFFSKISDQKK